MGSTIDDSDLLAYRHRAVLGLNEELVVLTTTVNCHRRHGIHVARNFEKASSSRYWAMSIFSVPATFFPLLIWAEPPARDTEIPTLTAGRKPGLKIALKVNLSVGNGNHIGRDISGNVASLSQ